MSLELLSRDYAHALVCCASSWGAGCHFGARRPGARLRHRRGGPTPQRCGAREGYSPTNIMSVNESTGDAVKP